MASKRRFTCSRPGLLKYFKPSVEQTQPECDNSSDGEDVDDLFPEVDLKQEVIWLVPVVVSPSKQ